MFRTDAVANAASDGHTLLVSAPFVIDNQPLETGLRWKPTGFVPVARFALSPGSEFVAFMKEEQVGWSRFAAAMQKKPQ
jgi:hypothetical protein